MEIKECQKYMYIDKESIFRKNVNQYIINHRRISVEQIVNYFKNLYQAETFQHLVDLSIAVKFVIIDLLKYKRIELYDNNNLINKNHNLIANEQGIVGVNYSPTMFKYVFRTILGKTGIDISNNFLHRYY